MAGHTGFIRESGYSLMNNEGHLKVYGLRDCLLPGLPFGADITGLLKRT
jgi:hypothetical protein